MSLSLEKQAEEKETMASYMFLLYSGPDDFADVSPAEIQKVIEKYNGWRDSLHEQGKLLGSQKLKDDEGRVLRRKGGEATRVLDGPYSETKEVIGGYFAVTAEDYDAAVAIAESCPHLDYGGTIEIRAIDPIH